jgi:hypothetical protein
MILVVAGQFLRSVAMIHASTNFSHSVAFRKRETHQLVTDGVYAYVQVKTVLLCILTFDTVGSATRPMPDFSIGRLVPNLCFKTL